jgi:hypothetical protein
MSKILSGYDKARLFLDEQEQKRLLLVASHIKTPELLSTSVDVDFEPEGEIFSGPPDLSVVFLAPNF